VGFARNIERDLAALGGLLDRLGLPATLISPIRAHSRAVKEAAGRLGLVSPNDVEHVIPRHSADSLLFALVRRPAPGERWVDVGSGAGFPGLVLACAFPECSFTLVEPLEKRAGFLELTAADLGLGNLDVRATRVEELEPDLFDVAVARALTEPSEALRSMLRVVRPAGQAIVAISRDAAVITSGTIVELGDLGNVDSPGLFSMMTREG